MSAVEGVDEWSMEKSEVGAIEMRVLSVIRERYAGLGDMMDVWMSQ